MATLTLLLQMQERGSTATPVFTPTRRGERFPSNTAKEDGGALASWGWGRVWTKGKGRGLSFLMLAAFSVESNSPQWGRVGNSCFLYLL